MQTVVDLNPITDLLNDLLRSEFLDWKNFSTTLLDNAIEHSNAVDLDAGCDSLVDALIKRGLWTVSTIPKVDVILDMFRQTFSCSAIGESKVRIDYDMNANAALVEHIPVRPRSVYLDNLKDEYHHAIERSDFIPERLRRAFEEIVR